MLRMMKTLWLSRRAVTLPLQVIIVAVVLLALLAFLLTFQYVQTGKLSGIFSTFVETEVESVVQPTAPLQ